MSSGVKIRHDPEWDGYRAAWESDSIRVESTPSPSVHLALAALAQELGVRLERAVAVIDSQTP